MNKDDKVYTVNDKTGEKKDGYFVYIPYPKPKIRSGWIMTFQDSLEIIATDKDMTGETLKVMLLLMGNLEFENYIHIKQVELAKKLEMQKTHVSRAIKVLVDKGIILKVKDGTTAAYKLNATYGWKGKVSNLQKEMKKQPVVNLQEYSRATGKKSDK